VSISVSIGPSCWGAGHLKPAIVIQVMHPWPCVFLLWMRSPFTVISKFPVFPGSLQACESQAVCEGEASASAKAGVKAHSLHLRNSNVPTGEFPKDQGFRRPARAILTLDLTLDAPSPRPVPSSPAVLNLDANHHVAPADLVTFTFLIQRENLQNGEKSKKTGFRNVRYLLP
jgi:hypothetical protein